MKSLLILGAFEPELAPLRSLLATYTNIYIQAVGIGLINASVNTCYIIERLLEQTKTSIEILWVGSVGKNSNVKHDLLSLVTSTETTLIDPGVITGYSKLPELMNIRVSSLSHISYIADTNKIAQRVNSIYTTLGITSSKAIVERLDSHYDANFESMELFAVASAAKKYNIPWTAISAITNHIGNTDEWQENFREAARITSSRIKKLITILRAGSIIQI